MFPRGSIILNKNTGKQFRVLATPDNSAILADGGERIPCYGLEEWDEFRYTSQARVTYVAQDVVEGGEMVPRDGCPP